MPLRVRSDAEWPGQRSALDTPAITSWTCRPQPAHVVLPHVVHRTGRHMVAPFRGGGVCGQRASYGLGKVAKASPGQR